MTQKKNTSEAAKGPHFLELKEIKRLIAVLSQAGASEIELEHLGARLRIRMPEPQPRTEYVQVPSPYPVGGFVPPQGGGEAERPAEGTGDEARAEAELEGLQEIRSPMVGTFYRAPAPDADPFVKVGDKVGPDTTVCIIEAMKVMNEIKAEMEGEIVKILAENGEPIEYGQPLFLVKPL